MHEEVIIAGFGGQGILFAGQILAQAALIRGLHVTWLPSYGPEMRGGTAHCTVVISDDEIGSPVVHRPSCAIVLNAPSFEKYEPLVAPGGILVYNSSLIEASSARTDVSFVAIAANQIAQELGDLRVANMAALGALVAASSGLRQGIGLDTIAAALEEHLPQRHRDRLPQNLMALRRGADVVREHSMGSGPHGRGITSTV
ncbi:MAG: 2-oxoacid:acceptor oxidoreductase family protein [Anaerolineae bacterium]